MATITSAQTGNFADGSTWVGGGAPGVADTAVVGTGHVVTIAANATCVSLTNTGTGKFVLGDGVTLTANVVAGGNAYTTCIDFSATTGAIVGNLTMGAVDNAIGVNNWGNGTLTITGDLLGDPIRRNAHTLLHSGEGTTNITGNCTGGGLDTCHAVMFTGPGVVSIVGNCTGGTGGTDSNACCGVAISGNGTLYITGTVACGATGSAFGLQVLSTSTGQIYVIGSVRAVGVSAIWNASRTARMYLTGPFYTAGSLGINPLYARSWMWHQTVTSSTFLQLRISDGVTNYNLVTQDSVAGTPAVGDVRFGTTFGVGDVLTGTMRVPDVGSVALGVPVDNTVGTAILTAAAIRAELATELACLDVAVSTRNATAPPSAADNLAALTASDLGLRLANASTVETTGAQIAAALSP